MLELQFPTDKIFKNGSVKFNPSFKTSANALLQKTQTEFSQEVLRMTEKYTPKDTGALINSANISSNMEKGELKWNTPYARRQYYLVRKTISQTGSLRSSHWGLRCKNDNLAHFAQFVKTRLRGL